MKMKSRTSESPVRPCYTYLKPGALAQIRNSKINAKSRFQDAQALILLLQENHNSGSDPSPPQTAQPSAMDGLPCFNLRIRNPRPRCLLSKRLFAVIPIFSESHS